MTDHRLVQSLSIILFFAAMMCAFAGAVRAQESARQVVERMVAAHGGMEAWTEAPSVTFTDTWTRPGAPGARTSTVQVEQGRRRAVLEFPDMNATVGWDGEKAWSVNWSGGPPRFLALLNYYFVCLPWLVEDPGVVLHEPQTRTLWDDPTEYIAIRVTYEPGVGDTPDDYYILFIDPQTYRLHGCEYVVTYPGLVPEGMEHTPPHILIYESLTTVDGLVVPTQFTVYNKGDEKSVYARCAIRDWSFREPFDPTRVKMPEGAVVDESLEQGK
jgi:hypothetical protein